MSWRAVSPLANDGANIRPTMSLPYDFLTIDVVKVVADPGNLTKESSIEILRH